MKTKIISISIIVMLALSNAILLFGIHSKAEAGEDNNPQSFQDIEWYPVEGDPNEGGCEDYKDVKFLYYHINDYYLYLRLEFYGYPNVTEHDMRLKWFIDTDLPHNMGWQGNKVYDAEYLLFIEDSPKPHGDGTEDIYLIHDSNNDGFMNDETKDGNGSGYEEFKISNASIAGFNITGHYLDMYIRQANISNPEHPYFTWTTDQGDPNLDSSAAHDQSDSYWNTSLSKADVCIKKSDSKDPVFTNESYSYTLEITNNGPHIARHYNITDIQPPGITFTSTTPLPTEIKGLEYRWYIPIINVSETKIIKINVTINTGVSGKINNTAYANNTYDPSPQDNTASEETTILKIVDLNIEKTSEYEEPAHAGSLIVYTINVTNHGPDQATNINVTDTLPDGVTFLNATPDATEKINDMQYRWYTPVLDVDESFIIKINVSVNESFYGIIVNTATIEYDYYDPGNGNDDNDTIIVLPITDLSIIKTSYNARRVYANELIIYYLNVTNNGPDIAYNVSVTDILPNGVTFTDSNYMPIGINGQTYQWVIESIDVNESKIIRINVTVNNSFSGIIKNIATVIGESYDPNEENNQDEVTITVYKKSSGGGGGGGGSAPPTEPFTDEKPTAIISGIYIGVPYEEIEFDGTESHDNDEEGQSIIRYDWKFSDELEWQLDLDATPSYIYTIAGLYNVTLRVIDDENSSDINTTTVIITKPNTPPTIPEINGPENGTTNVSYNYTVVSTDEDGDELKYTIEWGDGTKTESNYLPTGIIFNAAHKWVKPGTYSITVTAEDIETISTEELIIEIIEPEKESEFPCLLFLLILFLIILLLLILEKRRRDKKKQAEIKPTAKKASTKQ